MIIPILIAVVLVLLAYTYLKKDAYSHLPVVNVITTILFRRDLKQVIVDVTNKHNASVVRQWPHPVGLIATHPDTVRTILQGDNVIFEKAEMSPGFGLPFGPFLAPSVVMVNGDTWKNQRSAMGEAFHHDFLKKLFPLFAGKVDHLFNCWEKEASQPKINVLPWMKNLTVDIIGESALAQEFDLTGGKKHHFVDNYDYLMTTISIPHMVFPILNKIPLPSHAKILAAQKETWEWLYKAVVERRKMNKHECLIDMMVHSDMPEHEVAANVFVFFFAGHETTASTLGWAMHFLAKYPALQERMRAEVIEQSAGQPLTYEITRKLVYMDMFLKEVLRIHPIASGIVGRVSHEDLQVGDLVLKKDSQISVSITAIHHRPDFWPEPDKFDPERFSPENSVGRHPFSYLPFSLGRRHCIGMNFSHLEQRAYMAKFLQQYKAVYVEDAPMTKAGLAGPAYVNVKIERL